MVTPETIRGACLCEAVQFEVTPPTKWCAHCHCTMCRRAHGAGLVTWFGAAHERFRLTAGEAQLQWYQSSPGARRGFCQRCGSSVFFEGERWPGEIHITRASVAGAIDREPLAHVFYDVRVDWLELHDELRKLGGPQGNQRLAPAG
ncbi:MAG TPA: GFA family protein [Steroidobacteraceae bacterium]|nr:GFA family protein [Steroidobacteraceae bacterium]